MLEENHNPKVLPLWPGAQPCVNSGYCCKQVPCPFGDWNSQKTQCKHLTDDNLCGIFEEILDQPGWEIAPAFGAGCCSPMNTDRQKILRARKLILEEEWKNGRTDRGTANINSSQLSD